MERCTKEQRVIIVKNLLQNLLQNSILCSYWDAPYNMRTGLDFIVKIFY